MKGVKYIYNIQQAKFFIKYGVVCIDTGINPSTGKVYWAFGYDECQDAYREWNNNKKEIK